MAIIGYNAHQVPVDDNKPRSNSPKDLFCHCVKVAKQKNLFSAEYTHNQWAGKMFGYEKNSDLRIDNMSKVKREYSVYFTHSSHTSKYSYDVEKIKRDFPKLLGLEDNDAVSDECTCDEIVDKAIKVLNREICEQQDPQNIESFKVSNLSSIKQQGGTNIYSAKLTIQEGQEPHFHEGIPFKLKVYDKEFLCEIVDFDYDKGLLFFTSKLSIPSAEYCNIYLDSSFNLIALQNRLKDIVGEGVDDDLPFTKFFFGETEELVTIPHIKVASRYKKGLDKSQEKAFDAAIDNDITFIWGPPGTGKSYTLASIIYALYSMNEERTIVCCLSNVAVDQLLCKLLDLIDSEGVEVKSGNIYRAGRTNNPRIIDTDYLFPNDHITDDLRVQIKRNSEKLQRYKELKRDMTDKAIALKALNKNLRESLKERTDFLVNKSRTVFSTISNFVLSSRLCESIFDNLIVDEASMLAMPSLIALGSKITKRIIMVGDFQQLSPISMVKVPFLIDSVFKLSNIDIERTSHPGLHQLLNQRRSNEKLVGLINDVFYKGNLIPTRFRENVVINSEPYSGRVIALKAVSDGKVRFTKGGTRQNKLFAEAVIELLDEFYGDKITEFSIGVITPYKGQVALLKALKRERKYDEGFDERVRIGTIHTFQGSECDVIIYDMVDCSELENGKKANIGKIYSGEDGERLLNVAVSRAKDKLIVVCDPNFIKNIPGNTVTHKTRKIFEKLWHYGY